MTGYIFGGGASDFVYRLAGAVMIPAANQAVTFWSAQTGGTQYTVTLNGNSVTSVTTNATGFLPVFTGPTTGDVQQLWADAGGSSRQLIVAQPGNLAHADQAQGVTAVQQAQLRANFNIPSDVAYAEDTANNAIPLAAGAFTPLSPNFSVPPSSGDVWLTWQAHILVTAAGAGTIFVGPGDITGGSTPAALLDPASGGTSWLAGGWSQYAATLAGNTNVGASTAWRTFRLYGYLGRDTGSALAASVQASGTSPYGYKHWMRATVAA